MMSEWKKYKLDDLIEVKHGFAFKGTFITDTPTKDILVTPGNFKIGGGFKDLKFKYYTGECPESYTLKTGDIVVTMTDLSQDTDTLGYSAKIPERRGVKFLHNQRIGLVDIKSDEVIKDFLYWVLRTYEYQGFIKNSASGTSIMHTSPKNIKEYEFLLPPLPEQAAIAEVLSSLDDKIDLLHRQNSTIEKLASMLFRQWFIEEENGWEVRKIDSVVTIKGGGTPSTTNPSFWNGNMNWTSPRDLSRSNNLFLVDTEKKITALGLKKVSSGLLPVGTLLLSSRAPIGYLALTEIPVAINQGYIAMICNKGFSKYYMYLWVKQNMDLILNAANGSVFDEISKTIFRDLDFLIPPKEAIQNIENEIEPLFEKIKSNAQQIKTLTQLRNTLLPKLMNGTVKVW